MNITSDRTDCLLLVLMNLLALAIALFR